MKQERRYTHSATVRMDGDNENEAKRITGLGIVFYREGVEGSEYELTQGVKERIMPEAVDRALAESDDVRGLFNHDSNMLLGRTSAGTMALRKTEAGIEYDITPGSTTVHQNVQEHIERGDLTGSSFAFIVTDSEWIEADGNDVRLIRGVELFDVGPVTFPAYEATTAGLRNDGEGEEWRESYNEWRTRKDAQIKEQRTADDVAEANECNEAHRAETARQRRIDSAKLLSAGKTCNS